MTPTEYFFLRTEYYFKYCVNMYNMDCVIDYDFFAFGLLSWGH